MDITPQTDGDDTILLAVEGCFACRGRHTTPLLHLEFPVVFGSTTFVFRTRCPKGTDILVWMPPDPRSEVVCHLAAPPESGLVSKR